MCQNIVPVGANGTKVDKLSM